MADANIGIAIRAKNEASGALKQVKADIQGLDKSAGKVAGNLASALTGGGLGAILGGLGVGATIAAIDQIGGAIEGAVMAADRLGKLRGSFDELASGAGQSADQMLAAMRAASNGMITDADLILSANKAMLLGVADSADELTSLLQVAQARGKAMGMSATDAFNDIVTGLGRESALILDNLGITIDTTSVMEDYARSLGVAADQLDSTQRKQALLNEVMRQSQNIKPTLPTGAGAAAAQAEVARQQAQAAMGQFFAGPSREWAQIQADALNMLMGQYSEFGAAVREVNDLLADQESGRVSMPEDQAERLRQWAMGLQEVATAAAAGLPEAKAYLDTLTEMSARGLSKGFTAQDINVLNLATSSIRNAAQALREQEAAQAAAAEQANRASPYYSQIVQRENEMKAAAADAAADSLRFANALAYLAQTSGSAAGAVAGAQSAISSIIGTMAAATAAGYDMANAMALVNKYRGLDAQAMAVRQGLGNLSFYEPEEIDLIIQVNNQKALNEVNEVVGAFNDIESAIKSISSITPGLIEDMGLDQALAWQKEQESSLRTQVDLLREQGYTDEQIGVALRGNVQQTQAWASGLDKVSSGTSDIKKQYDDLKSKVAGVLSSQLDVGVGVKASDLLPREDEINENARRLADIAQNGLNGQEWMDAFMLSAPETWAELMQKIAEGADAKSAAAQILRDFEDGLQPDLIDKTKAKERVKRMILGEQSMAQLAEEVAKELAAEMGIPLQEAMAAAGASLGVTSGAAGKAAASATGGEAPDMTGAGQGAGATFVAGFSASVNGAALVAGVVASMASADLEPLNGSGAMAGTQWGAGFVENASGAVLVASIIAKIAAELPRFKDSGGAAGTQWGAGFMGTVETGIAQPLINLLTTLVTPGVLAAIQAGNSQTTPP